LVSCKYKTEYVVTPAININVLAGKVEVYIILSFRKGNCWDFIFTRV